MSSPSRYFCEPVHLSAFLFASFPNAYKSNKTSIKQKKENGNLQRVHHLGSFRKAKFIDELESGPIDSSGLF